MKMELFENALETGKNKNACFAFWCGQTDILKTDLIEDDYVVLIMLFPCQASFPQTQIENNPPLT